MIKQENLKENCIRIINNKSTSNSVASISHNPVIQSDSVCWHFLCLVHAIFASFSVLLFPLFFFFLFFSYFLHHHILCKFYPLLLIPFFLPWIQARAWKLFSGTVIWIVIMWNSERWWRTLIIITISKIKNCAWNKYDGCEYNTL